MRNILFICGSLNQTTQMHAISRHLSGYGLYFTQYYSHGLVGWCAGKKWLEFSILGHKLASRSLAYMRANNLDIDERGEERDYDLILTCSDLVIPRNIRNSAIVLVQEGMTDPENMAYYAAKYLRLPRWIASTSTTGLSHAYVRFCVASEGYKDLFIRKGVRPETLVVTGIPNFDNCISFLKNDFPHSGYVLVATSDMRETFKYENRSAFIRKCVQIADGRQLVFKLHPNENAERAAQEIRQSAPGALIFPDGDVNHMIANCDVLITRYSSVVYSGLALGKEVYSDFDLEELQRKAPLQNGGTSAMAIANVCRSVIEQEAVRSVRKKKIPRSGLHEFVPRYVTRTRHSIKRN